MDSGSVASSLRHAKRGTRPEVAPRAAGSAAGVPNLGSYNNGQYRGSSGSRQGSGWTAGGSQSSSQGSYGGRYSPGRGNGYGSSSQYGSSTGRSAGSGQSSGQGADNGQWHPGKYAGSSSSSQGQSASSGQYNSGQYQQSSSQDGSTNGQSNGHGAAAAYGKSSNGQYHPGQSNQQQSSSNKHGPAHAPDSGQHHPGQYQHSSATNAQNDQAGAKHRPAHAGIHRPNQPQQQQQQDPNDPNDPNDPKHNPATQVKPLPTETAANTDSPTGTGTSTLQTSLSTDTSVPTTSPTLAASHSNDSDNSTAMQPGTKAAISICVILAVILICMLILRPIRRHHKRVQESLGRGAGTKQPKWKSEKVTTDAGTSSGRKGITDPLYRLATGVHSNASTTVVAASTFLKPKAEAASSYFKPKAEAFYTHNPFSKSSATLFSHRSQPPKSRDAEAGFAGYAAEAGQLGPIPKLPMIRTSKESFSESSRRDHPVFSSDESESGGQSRPSTVGREGGGGDAEGNGPTAAAGGGGGGGNTSGRNTAAASPIVTPMARSVSSVSTAWETQAEQQSPLGSPRSPHSPIGSLDNHSTGNLLAVNPAINETYVAERDFQPQNPGQIALKEGDRLGISQTFENGWALCIRCDGSEAGLVPRDHLSKIPVKRQVSTDHDKRRSMAPPQHHRGLGALGPRFYTWFRNSNSHAR